MNCPNCGHTVEALHHTFWECRYTIQVWKRIIRILERKGERLSLTWGMAAWSSLSKDIEGYDSPSVTYKLLIENGASTMIPQQTDIWLEPSKKVYLLCELLSSPTLCVLWKFRNVALFEGIVRSIRIRLCIRIRE